MIMIKVSLSVDSEMIFLVLNDFLPDSYLQSLLVFGYFNLWQKFGRMNTDVKTL